jgi:hypothetical protein
MANPVLPNTFGSNYLRSLNTAIMNKNPDLIVYPLIIFDFLASAVRPLRQQQPFFVTRPDYLKSFWPKWITLIERRNGNYDAAALAVLTAYVKKGGLYEVDLDTL